MREKKEFMGEGVDAAEESVGAESVSDEALETPGSFFTPRVVVSLLSFFLIIAAGTAVYFYTQASDLRKNPQRIAQEEVASVVSRVSRLIVLPEGEQPTVATVNDPEKLKTQPFFANTKVGDRVLIYPNARKAILYNPGTDKIVEVAPLNIGNPPPSQ